MTFHQKLFLTWMIQGCAGKVTVKNLYLEEKKKSVPGSKASKDRLNLLLGGNSKIKALTGVSLRNSQSSERHSKISFASHLDFKQKGLCHAINFLRMVL